MRAVLVLLLLAPASTWAAPRSAHAQSPPAAAVRYEVAFPNRAHHEAEITLRIANLPPGPVELRMSRTSPGRYSLHEFAKNVYGVAASDARSRGSPDDPGRRASS